MLLLFTSFFSLIQILHFFLSVLSPVVLLLKLLLVSFLAWLAFRTSSYNRLLTFLWPSSYNIQCTPSSGRTVLVGIHVCFARPVRVNCFLCKSSYCRNTCACFLILLRLASAKYHGILSESLVYILYTCSPNTEPSQARRVCLTTASFGCCIWLMARLLERGTEPGTPCSTHTALPEWETWTGKYWKILEISCKEGLKLRDRAAKGDLFWLKADLGQCECQQMVYHVQVCPWDTSLRLLDPVFILRMVCWPYICCSLWSCSSKETMLSASSELPVINAYRPMSQNTALP